MSPSQTPTNMPAFQFQITSSELQLLNCNWDQLLGLTPNRWRGIWRGGWRSLVPVEYHPEVKKLALVPLSESYTVAEFPVYWQERTLWLLVFAAAVALPEGGRKIAGLVQDVTREREGSFAASNTTEPESEPAAEEPSVSSAPEDGASAGTDSMAELCHDLSGPVTSILVNCELLLESECPPPMRQRLESIFSEAMQINQHLRSYRRP